VAAALACDLQRSDAHPAKLFQAWNNGDFEAFSRAFHRDSLEWINGQSLVGIFNGWQSVDTLSRISAALTSPTLSLDMVYHKSDSETAFVGTLLVGVFEAKVSGFFEYRHCRISHARIWSSGGNAFTRLVDAITQYTPPAIADPFQNHDDDDDNSPSDRLFDTSYSHDDDDSSSSSTSDSISSSSFEKDSDYCSSSSSSSSSDMSEMSSDMSSDMSEMSSDMSSDMSSEDMESPSSEEPAMSPSDETEEGAGKRRRHVHHGKTAQTAVKELVKRSSDDDDDASSSDDDDDSSSSSSSSYDCQPNSVARDAWKSLSCHEFHHFMSLHDREAQFFVEGVLENNGDPLSQDQVKCIAYELRHFRFHVDSVVRHGDESVAVRGYVETFDNYEVPLAVFYDFTKHCRIERSSFFLPSDAGGAKIMNAFGACNAV